MRRIFSSGSITLVSPGRHRDREEGSSLRQNTDYHLLHHHYDHHHHDDDDDDGGGGGDYAALRLN